ncbi:MULTISPECIES: hypothetical protein [unclassified Acidiphilium]|uniref:hypothetical protein n=1 Tax=unclassified Acidiphilium TaxID=2617493 RepID=UPI000BCA7230|nr:MULTISPECIES: hypothetical protein [unclassified Acidiphilium]OYV54520.1 MAG: hypothetical protein B7Z76_14185 [Acidiphilium sp. 20-67-58]HQT62531.1 hypothetical protein [Acidiphilium sp.]
MTTEPTIIVERVPAFGWVRRRDIGPTAWERPDGRIYLHWDETVPKLARLVVMDEGGPLSWGDAAGDADDNQGTPGGRHD